MVVLGSWRVRRAIALLAAMLLAGIALLAGLLVVVAWEDLAFRGRDALQAPDAVFTMRFFGLVAAVFAACSIFALWKGGRS
ncbi:MAG: hypothetical protein AAGA15_05250 [Pseudomonadota bacterium]